MFGRPTKFIYGFSPVSPNFTPNRVTKNGFCIKMFHLWKKFFVAYYELLAVLLFTSSCGRASRVLAARFSNSLWLADIFEATYMTFQMEIQF
jgi:hypothetical protein